MGGLLLSVVSPGLRDGVEKRPPPPTGLCNELLSSGTYFPLVVKVN